MLTLKAAMEQYVDDYLLLEKGLSSATVSAYGRDLRQYRDYLEGKGKEKLSGLELGDIENFVNRLRENGLALSSIARKISALRTFHRFCLTEGLSENDPTEFLKSRQPKRRLPRVIPSEDIEKLMELPSDSTPVGMRDRAMLEMLYGCGLRISELVNLALTHIHLTDEIIRVEGKGDKTRFVPIGSKALRALHRHLEMGRPDFVKSETDDAGTLFLNRFGKPLSRVGAYGIIKAYLKRAYPGKDYTPHTLRHSFATHIIEGGGDIRTVQELLGHESIATTQIYTHLDRRYLKSIVSRYHPRG